MSKIFTIRQGDRLPWLAYKFPFSLVTAVGVTFSAREEPGSALFIDRQPGVIANGTYVIEGVSTPLTPADGVAFYPWGPTDTSAVRKSCMALFHVIWPGSLQETVPSEGYERFTIGDNF